MALISWLKAATLQMLPRVISQQPVQPTLIMARPGQLLSVLNAIHSERRKSRHILLGLLAKQPKFEFILKAMPSGNRPFELLSKAINSVLERVRLVTALEVTGRGG